MHFDKLIQILTYLPDIVIKSISPHLCNQDAVFISIFISSFCYITHKDNWTKSSLNCLQTRHSFDIALKIWDHKKYYQVSDKKYLNKFYLITSRAIMITMQNYGSINASCLDLEAAKQPQITTLPLWFLPQLLLCALGWIWWMLIDFFHVSRLGQSFASKDLLIYFMLSYNFHFLSLKVVQ